MAERAPISVASRGIGGAGSRPVSAAPSFSPFRSEGGKVSTSISFGSLGKENMGTRPSNRFSTPFAPSIPSGERSVVKPTPSSPDKIGVQSGPTVSSVSGLIAQKPYEGMFGSGRISGRAENTPVSLVKEPRFNAATKSVEPVRSFIKKLPGGEISPQVSERQATPTRTLYYPTWGRTQSVERPSSNRIAEVRQALRNIPTGENVSLSKVVGTGPESKPIVENKPNSAVSYGALLAKREEIKSGHPETRPIGAVRTDIQRIVNPWTPKISDTVASPSAEPNKTVVSTGKAERSPHRGSAFMQMMEKREEEKKAKTRVLSSNTQIVETQQEAILQPQEDSVTTTGVSESLASAAQSAKKTEAKKTTGLQQKLFGSEKAKRAFKKAAAPGITQKNESSEAYPYKVDDQARKERVKQWSNAVKRIFPFFNFTFSVPLKEVVQVLDPANQVTQSALIRQTGGSKDGSDIEWRNAVNIDTLVTKGEAYLAGVAAIDTRPPVVMRDEGLDVKDKDVRLVLDGEKKDDAQPTADAA